MHLKITCLAQFAHKRVLNEVHKMMHDYMKSSLKYVVVRYVARLTFIISILTSIFHASLVITVCLVCIAVVSNKLAHYCSSDDKCYYYYGIGPKAIVQNAKACSFNGEIVN